MSPNDDEMFVDPLFLGIREHYERTQWYLGMSAMSINETHKFRHLMAGVYSGRAVVELMLDGAKNQVLSKFNNKDGQLSRKNFEAQLVPKVKHYHLLERIRIHDFHRIGILPPGPTRNKVFFNGPMVLKARKGGTTLTIPSTGPKITRTGDSPPPHDQRSMCWQNEKVYDDVSSKYIPLNQVIAEYLKTLPDTIDWYAQLMNP